MVNKSYNLWLWPASVILLMAWSATADGQQIGTPPDVASDIPRAVTTLGEDKGTADAKKPAVRFDIKRDSKLGKPLLTVRQPSKDAKGRTGVDVLEQFLMHVRDGEIEKAKALCRFSIFGNTSPEEIASITKNEILDTMPNAAQLKADLAASEARFPDYVRELQKATRYTLGATVKQKSTYWTIAVKADGVREQPWPSGYVYLSFEKGEWRVEVGDLVFRYDESKDSECCGSAHRAD